MSSNDISRSLSELTRRVYAPKIAEQLLKKPFLVEIWEKEHPPVPPTLLQRLQWWFRYKRVRLGEIIAGRSFDNDW